MNSTLAFNNPDGVLASYHTVVLAMLGNGESSSPSNTSNFQLSITAIMSMLNMSY